VHAVLEDYRRAPIDERLKVTLAFLEKLTLHPEEVGPADAAAVRAAGVSDEALEEAIQVCALFNIVDRVADALGFEVPSSRVTERVAEVLLKRGYA
jgi:alkylhydroperoxidase family enzyme